MLETVNGLVMIPIYYLIYYLVRWELQRWKRKGNLKKKLKNLGN